MEKVRFSWPNPSYCGDYECSKPCDQSGEYVRAEVAESFKAVLQEFIAWNEKYPSSRIFSEAEIRVIAKELDAINEKAIAAIANAEK